MDRTARDLDPAVALLIASPFLILILVAGGFACDAPDPFAWGYWLPLAIVATATGLVLRRRELHWERAAIGFAGVALFSVLWVLTVGFGRELPEERLLWYAACRATSLLAFLVVVLVRPPAGLVIEGLGRIASVMLAVHLVAAIGFDSMHFWLGNINYQVNAATLAVCLWWSILLLRGERSWWAWAGWFLVLADAYWFSRRAASLCWLLSSVSVLSWYLLPRWRRPLRLVAPLAMALTLCLLVYACSLPLQTTMGQVDPTDRMWIYRSSALWGAELLPFGGGPSATLDSFASDDDEIRSYHAVSNWDWHPHNLVLEWFQDGGIPGLICLGLLAGLALRRLGRLEEGPEAAAGTILLSCLTIVAMASVLPGTLFGQLWYGLLLGLFWVLPIRQPVDSQVAGRPARFAGRLLLGAGSACLVVLAGREFGSALGCQSGPYPALAQSINTQHLVATVTAHMQHRNLFSIEEQRFLCRLMLRQVPQQPNFRLSLAELDFWEDGRALPLVEAICSLLVADPTRVQGYVVLQEHRQDPACWQAMPPQIQERLRWFSASPQPGFRLPEELAPADLDERADLLVLLDWAASQSDAAIPDAEFDRFLKLALPELCWLRDGPWVCMNALCLRPQVYLDHDRELHALGLPDDEVFVARFVEQVPDVLVERWSALARRHRPLWWQRFLAVDGQLPARESENGIWSSYWRLWTRERALLKQTAGP
jgi:hypothetical protein